MTIGVIVIIAAVAALLATLSNAGKAADDTNHVLTKYREMLEAARELRPTTKAGADADESDLTTKKV